MNTDLPATRAKLLLFLLAAITLVASSAAPAEATEFFIPEDNSAVNQYTEGFPTGAGDREADDPASAPNPNRTLGHATTERLEREGPEGIATALLAASTAPPSVATGEATRRGAGGKRPAAPDRGGDDAAAGTGEPSGSAPLGEIATTATGVSGGINLLLPLALAAILAWGVGYTWRRRPGTHGTKTS